MDEFQLKQRVRIKVGATPRTNASEQDTYAAGLCGYLKKRVEDIDGEPTWRWEAESGLKVGHIRQSEIEAA